MTDHEQALAELDIYGFTVVHDVLDAGQVAAMKAALMRCEREVGTDHRHRGAARHVANLPTLDRCSSPAWTIRRSCRSLPRGTR